jgi:uncharacterized protein (DUF433 family)
MDGGEIELDQAEGLAHLTFHAGELLLGGLMTSRDERPDVQLRRVHLDGAVGWPEDRIRSGHRRAIVRPSLKKKGVRVLRFTRITVDARQMGGVPCIRGLRMPVATVVGMVADGLAVNEILHEHPTLEAEDVREALQYAAAAVRERMIPLEA